jgi:hypothetical protein
MPDPATNGGTELSAASERFRELWARADVGYRLGVLHMRHPLLVICICAEIGSTSRTLAVSAC